MAPAKQICLFDADMKTYNMYDNYEKMFRNLIIQYNDDYDDDIYF